MKRIILIIIVGIIAVSNISAAVYVNKNLDDIQKSSTMSSLINTNTQKYNFQSLISSTYLGGSNFDGGLDCFVIKFYGSFFLDGGKKWRYIDE